jgi:Carboxypeptidase regulatory-like domain/TonB dependent receptor
MISKNHAAVFLKTRRVSMKIYSRVRLIITQLLLIAIVLMPLSIARAQDPVTGAIEGYVFDSATKAPVADALVQFINTESGATLAKRTNAQGYYRQGLLPPGEYRIRVTKEGYASPGDELFTNYATRPNSVQPPIYLRAETAAVASASPEATPTTGQPTPTPSPAAATTATAAPRAGGASIASELNITDARRGGAYTDKEVSTLPLGGITLTRSFDELGLLVPGVAPPPQTASEIAGPGVGPSIGSAGQFAVNGMRSRANNFTVDGSDNNDEDIGVRRQGFFSLVPQPIESIKEFQITTLLAPAQFGRNFGAQVNALSRSGGNSFHGTIFGFLNSSQLNAVNFFDTTNGNATANVRSSTGQAVLNCTGLTNAGCIAANKSITTTNQSGGEDSFTLAQGGFVLGGPIKKDKAFFFVSYERQVLNASQEHSFAVPTVDQRGIFNSGATGFFIDCLDANPGFNISNCNNANRAQFFADFGFPTELHGDAVLSLFPFANNPTGIYGANTFTERLPASARGNIASGKYDQKFKIGGQDQTFTARYNFTQDWRDVPVTGGALFSSLRPRARTQNFSTFLTSGITNRMSNVLRLSYGQTRLAFDEIRDPFLSPSQISPNEPFLLNARRLQNDTLPVTDGIPNAGAVLYRSIGTTECGLNDCTFGNGIGRVGQVNVAGFSSLGVDVDYFPQRRVNNTYQIADTVGYRIGTHSLAFGEDIRLVQLKSDLRRNGRTRLTFNGAPELDFFSPAPFTGNFLRGIDLAAAGAPSGAFLSLARTTSEINLRYNEYNFFGQDEWRIRPNLSLSFGLRYEYNTPPEEKNNLIESTFTDPLLNNINVRDINTFIAGRTKIFEPDKNNFEPRVGLAWSPSFFGPDHTTVVRAGFGVFHDQILGAVVSQSRNVFPNFLTLNTGGFNLGGEFSFFNPARGGCSGGTCGVFTPLVQNGTLNNFNPNLTVPTVLNIFASGVGFPNPISVTLPERNIQTPSAEQYGVTFEQQLNREMVLSVGYVGTRGHNLLRASTPNLGPNNVLIVFDAGAAAYGTLQPILLGFANAPGSIADIATFNRPNRNIGPVYIYDSGGRSHYDAVQLQLRGRFRNGLNFQGNYTYGKSKDDASDMFDLAGSAALPQNSITRAGEYGISNFDSRHRISYNLIYDFPKAGNRGSLYRAVFGGLQFASAGWFQEGQPFTVNSLFDVNLDGNLTDRLNTTQGIIETGNRQQPIALSPQFAGRSIALVGGDGSVPRNSFRAGNILNLDLAVVKNFSFSESRKLIFRMDVFNFINRANYGVPVRFLEAPSFGQATSTVTPARRIQFGLKFAF